MIAVNLSACAIVYNSPHLYLTRVVDGQCVAYGTGCLLSQIYSWCSFVLNAIIPFTSLIYMNVVIVKAVRNSRKMFGGQINAATDQGLKTRHNKHEKCRKSTDNYAAVSNNAVFDIALSNLHQIYISIIC